MTTNLKNTIYILILTSLALYFSCSKENSSELYPPNAIATCTDGIQNQGEFKVDCGATCEPCPLAPEMTAVIDSFWVPDTMRGPGLWKASVVVAEEHTSGLYILGVDTNTGNFIEFTHSQEFAVGVYTYQNIEGSSFGCDFTDGIVEFSAFDPIQQTVSGTFAFNCIGNFSGKKERVLNGKFVDIKYN